MSSGSLRKCNCNQRIRTFDVLMVLQHHSYGSELFRLVRRRIFSRRMSPSHLRHGQSPHHTLWWLPRALCIYIPQGSQSSLENTVTHSAHYVNRLPSSLPLKDKTGSPFEVEYEILAFSILISNYRRHHS
jgi:hypothetical protein